MQTPTESGAGLEPRFMYFGPKITGLGLLPGNVWIGGIPEHLAPFYKECPSLKKCFVELDMTKGKSRAATPLFNVEKKRGREAGLCADVEKWLESKKQLSKG